jgi:hypothetical protein
MEKAAYDVAYILPFRFLVLSQNFNKADRNLIIAHQGEAVCTYPYSFDVAENDCITVLSGSMTAKAVIPKRDGAFDTIPEFFVSEVSRLETAARIYQAGADFVLTGANRIRRLGENKPETGAYMSLVYRYYPTYRVAENIPMLRTSEDQRIPRKAILKHFAAFGEAKGVNKG